MLRLKINKKKFYYCTKQSEVTFRVGNLINDTLEEFNNDRDNIDFQKWALSFLCNTDYDTINLVSEEQIKVLIKSHPFFAPNILVGFRKYVKIKGRLYQYRDLELPTTVQEYSELDQLSNDKEFLQLLKALYKPIKCYPKHWLKYLIIKNAKSFDECSYFELQLAIFNYFMWKKNLMSKYNLLINNPNIPQEDQPDEVVLTKAEFFGMYHVLLTVSGDNIQTAYFWQDKDVRDLFKFIMYSKIKNNK